jgi:hypothetical protein
MPRRERPRKPIVSLFPSPALAMRSNGVAARIVDGGDHEFEAY